MLNVQGIERKFILKRGMQTVELADPNAEWKPERVRSFYEDTHSELINAEVINKGVIDDKMVFEFTTNPKVKG